MTVLFCLLAFQLQPPSDVRAADMPNDRGGSIQVSWALSPDDAALDGYAVLRADGATERVGFVGPGVRSFTDSRTVDGRAYRYVIAAVKDSLQAASAPSAPATSIPQWFDTRRINVLVVGLVFGGLLILFITRGRRGKGLFIRRIAGLAAVDEAVGRATEMGRPILYSPGLGYIETVSTIASLNILGEIAKKTAQYGTPLIVPNRDPIVYTVAREIVKEAYTSVGRPDAFNPDSVYFVTDSQFAYAAAVDGIMVREKPATNFLIGYFYAEALILAETGAASGAVQISGTDAITQLPFFVTACDYTMIGEELYAATAYLTRDPLLLGGIKGQDYGKLIIITVLTAASLLALLIPRWQGLLLGFFQ